ncbi:MAG: DUF616 domain-containing protein [Lachnospiraceae bacterium]|nr:DUF616 domain-containing protein [Lachnospiraceae bacterium]
MFCRDSNQFYPILIEAIKTLVTEKKEVLESEEYHIGKTIYNKLKILKNKGIAGIKDDIKKYSKFKKGESYSMAKPLENTRDYGVSNYFLNEKIAIYTCITGGYDTIVEPLFIPDNCEYYAITDFELPKDSKWKRIDISKIRIDDLDHIKHSPAFINRYFKMFPHKLFSDYKYSVYVDGNIRICTDMTEYVNRISDIGISTFCHSQRCCVFEEALACIAMGKESEANIEKHIRHLEDERMPCDYGMAQCSVIVREHNSAQCKVLMESWWAEYLNYAKRDQLSFPLVMYKHGIEMERITTLGANLYRSSSFEIITHKKL